MLLRTIPIDTCPTVCSWLHLYQQKSHQKFISISFKWLFFICSTFLSRKVHRNILYSIFSSFWFIHLLFVFGSSWFSLRRFWKARVHYWKKNLKNTSELKGMFLHSICICFIFYVWYFTKGTKKRLLFIFWFSANEHGKRLQGWKVISGNCKLQDDNCCCIWCECDISLARKLPIKNKVDKKVFSRNVVLQNMAQKFLQILDKECSAMQNNLRSLFGILTKIMMASVTIFWVYYDK